MKTLSERDKAVIWHPLTQEKTADLPIAIKKGKGSYLYDEKGKAYLDLISSWWVNLHGHAHPTIANAIYEQALALEQVIFAGFTHSPAVTLCERLQKILPTSLSRFFYSDNGSTAIEVALKMAYQYWHNQNEKSRTLFLSFEGGYHGDTFGAMAVGTTSGFHDVFQELLFNVLTIPFPATWDEDPTLESKEATALATLDRYLAEQGQRIAAIILEPLVQGASGMRMCRPSFIKEVVNRVRKYGILVIYDEIMTGFGRTGTLFALEQIQAVPDFLCLSKGLTGGFLPLSLTVTTSTVFEAFLADDWKKALTHSHSYTANPLACAAANASLTLLLQESTLQSIQAIQGAHEIGLAQLKKSPLVTQTRFQGTISAFELPSIEHARHIKTQCLAAGFLIRPIGKTVYLLPPYSTQIDDLKATYDMLLSTLT